MAIERGEGVRTKERALHCAEGSVSRLEEKACTEGKVLSDAAEKNADHQKGACPPGSYQQLRQDDGAELCLS
ncbi:hypothetical protein A6R68_22864 [Neotoma lepida]|uniref:Uncharacterized protein n=1 Tax=Neotoma lepida TaxID=56216 RepID=A0A1A6HY48_NEOLE|nr:hypothetical protein A6R68_22864 [Neotoma lepida]